MCPLDDAGDGRGVSVVQWMFEDEVSGDAAKVEVSSGSATSCGFGRSSTSVR